MCFSLKTGRFQRKAGCILVEDMLVNNRLKSFEDIQRSFPQTPGLYLQYITVRTALAEFMRKNIIDNTIIDINRYQCLIFNRKNLKEAKDFRLHIVNEKYSQPICERFWLTRFNIKLQASNYLLAKNVTQEARLQELHWKILHTIYPTNIMLQKMGLSNTNKCSYCPAEIDYVEHFFFYCNKIQVLWKYIEQNIYHRYKIRVQLSVEQVLCGYPLSNKHEKESNKYINHLILIGKMCVSKYRYGTPIDLKIMFDTEIG